MDSVFVDENNEREELILQNMYPRNHRKQNDRYGNEYGQMTTTVYKCWLKKNYVVKHTR